MATTLFLPYGVEIRRIERYGLPQYAVDLAASNAQLETRTLLSLNPGLGFLEVTIENTNPFSNEILEEFYDTCRTNHLAFTINNDHNLWRLIPLHSQRKFYPCWRFDSQLIMTLEDARDCSYITSITMVNVQA